MYHVYQCYMIKASLLHLSMLHDDVFLSYLSMLYDKGLCITFIYLNRIYINIRFYRQEQDTSKGWEEDTRLYTT